MIIQARLMAHTKRLAHINTVLSPSMECCHDVSCLRISVDREENIGRKYKGVTMAQWGNLLQNSSFINQMQ